jgi:hypothetical protein
MSEAVRHEVVVQLIWWIVVTIQAVLSGLVEWGLFALLQNPPAVLVFAPPALFLIPIAMIGRSIVRQARVEKRESLGELQVGATNQRSGQPAWLHNPWWMWTNRHPFVAAGAAAVVVTVLSTVLVLGLHISR